jgi:hypothetical protein
MRNFSKIAGSVVGTTTLAALPHAAGAGNISESEPANNTFTTAQAVNVGDTLNGSNNGGSDPIDFSKYTGLPVGGTFDFTVHHDACCSIQSFLLDAALYSDQTTTVSPPVPIDLAQGDTKHLQGQVPGSGQLVLGIKLLSSGFFEGYTVSLAVTPPSRVTQPATIALLLAGLTGLQVLRRRKRR